MCQRSFICTFVGLFYDVSTLFGKATGFEEGKKIDSKPEGVRRAMLSYENLLVMKQ